MGVDGEWTSSTPVVPGCALEYPSVDALSKMQAAPKFSFGSKPKKTTGDKDPSIPGPGSYFESYAEGQLRGRKTAPKFSFGAATRKELEKAPVPGPGAYGTKSLLSSGTGFSITPRRVEAAPQKHNSTPGPGSHMIPALLGLKGPRPTITPRRKTDARAEEKGLGPGPGQYNPTEDVLSQAKPPKWGFGTGPARPRIGKEKDSHAGSTPGPGAYRYDNEPGAYKGKGPKWSIRARTANEKVGILQDL